MTEAYAAIAGPVASALAHALPSAAVQGLLSLSDAEHGSQAAEAWAARLQSAASYLAAR